MIGYLKTLRFLSLSTSFAVYTTTAMSTGTRLVAEAVKTATARQAKRNRGAFSWKGWQGLAVTALCGVVAATSLQRRWSTEEEMELAKAHIARAESALSAVRDALRTDAAGLAVKVAPVTKHADVEKLVKVWVDEVIEREVSAIREPQKPAMV